MDGSVAINIRLLTEPKNPLSIWGLTSQILGGITSYSQV
jgi:hypothetical protein